MVKPQPFPSYQPLTLHLVCLSVTPPVYTTLPSIKFCICYKVETYTVSSNLSRDPLKFDRPGCNFANVNKVWKMTASVNFFYRGDLRVKFLREYNL